MQMWEPEKELFWQLEPFSELNTTFCIYWTSIKMKISMTCVYKEYKIKRKMVQEQWLQLKNEVFVRFKHYNCFLVGRELILW